LHDTLEGRQDLSRTYLAHHELESIVIVVVVVIIIIIIIIIITLEGTTQGAVLPLAVPICDRAF